MGAFQSAVNSAIGSVSQIAGINKLIQKQRGGTPTLPNAPSAPSAPPAPNQNNMQAESVQSQAKKRATKSARDAVTAKKSQKTEYKTKLNNSQAAPKTTGSTAKKSTLSDADIVKMVKELLGNGKK